MASKDAQWEALAQERADARYARIVEDAEAELLDARKELADKRAEGEEELEDARQKLDDARQELSDAEREILDGEAELADAKTELDENGEKLEDAKAQLADGRVKLDESKAQLSDARAELDEAKAQIDENEQKLEDARAQLGEAKAQLDAGNAELEKSRTQLDGAKAQLRDSKAQLDTADAQLSENEAQLADGQAQLLAGQREWEAANESVQSQQSALAAQKETLVQQQAGLAAQLADPALPAQQRAALEAAAAQVTAGLTQIAQGEVQLEAAGQTLTVKRGELAAAAQTLETGRAALSQGRAEYEAGLARYAEGLAQYEQGEAAYAQGRAQLDAAQEAYAQGLAEYESGAAQLAGGRAAYEAGEAQYADGLAQYEAGEAEYEKSLDAYEDGRAQYEEGLAAYEEAVTALADGRAEYEDGLAEYEDGLAEYEDGRAEFDEKIQDAEEKLSDAQDELDDLEVPDTYVLDRSANIGYACFESDSQIVEQVARVFPIFFILVAALVCMTTMSRMVEEQRTQIGVLKALGYGDGAVMGRFLVYAGSAACAGCVFGYAVGTVLFPQVIWMSYELMYITLPMPYLFDPVLAGGALVLSLLCSLGITWLTCRVELTRTAAALMRPKAPKAGKRVFLEYLPFLWNRLKFLHKVSVRNMLRYKGRFFMMVIGISGAAALLVTGFGLKDSVAGFAQVQYEEILTADASAALSAQESEGLSPELESVLGQTASEYLPMHEGSWDLVTQTQVKGMDIEVALGENIAPFMHLRTLRGEPLSLPGDGEALVSNSVSERFGVHTGDTITLRDETMRELHVTVTGVFENHVYNYVYLAPETFEHQLGEMPECNAVFLNFPEDTDIYKAQAALSALDEVTNVLLFDELKVRLGNMMSSLNYIVALVIGCAAGLAFIVLYNLTNINITERIREIATIKVLGFFRRETSAYVLRENIALTAIGTAVGLLLGILLHRFVMQQIVVDLVSFRIRVEPLSFLISAVLTFSFSLLVNAVMGIRLERINMAESLKSVD
ncbi:MAG: FtsX-like permease family protein [Oscillospiraceae bacterium]|nr:FtsX-like permease family protein [Oscillospiraceae bacterium]